MARKRKHYGSAASVHLTKARESTKAARWWAKETRRSLKAGNCNSALQNLVTAQRMSSIATENRRGSGRSRAMFQASTLASLTSRFAKLCVR